MSRARKGTADTLHYRYPVLLESGILLLTCLGSCPLSDICYTIRTGQWGEGRVVNIFQLGILPPKMAA